MGDLPGAGLAWFLTDGDDPRREEASGAMRERHGRRTPRVQERLRDLQGEPDAIGLRPAVTGV